MVPEKVESGTLGVQRWVVISIAVCFFVFLGWAGWAEIEEVAHARGQVIALSRTHLIQAAYDGVIQSLLVQEGQKVYKNQLLVQLERKQALAAEIDSQGKVAAIKANLSRLEAELFGKPLVFPKDVLSHPIFVENQTGLYKKRRIALEEEISVLQKSLGLVKQELEINKPLLSAGDVSKSDVLRLERSVSELEGSIVNRRNKYLQDLQAEMTKSQEDLATQKQILADRMAVLERTELRAPSDGVVRRIHLTTPGAKVRPGEVVMEILPLDSSLIVEAKMRPSDLAFIRLGMDASVKLDAYDYSIYGMIQAKVIYISPDALTEDSNRGIPGEQIYYRLQVSIDEDDLKRKNSRISAKKIEVQPGMTASVDIKTGSRTLLEYLTKPLIKTISVSMGER